MTHNHRATTTLPATLCVLVTLLVPGCKPQAPDLHAQRRPAASARAEAAKAAINTGASEVAGLTSEQSAAIVARIGEQAITLGDVASYVAQLPRSARARYVTPEQRRELVQYMVEIELLAREGEKRGFGTDPVVQHTYKKAMANELLRTVTTDISLGDLTDADADAYYDAHKAAFVRPERRRCAVIYFDTRADAVAASTGLAEAIAATPKATKQIFGDWAREKSVDEASGRLKGDLGWFDVKGLNEEGQTRVAGRLLETVYALKRVHQISGPLELESDQWIVTQMTGLRPAAEAPMADVRLEIQNALLKANRASAREDFIAALRAKATIDIDEAALADLPAPEEPDSVKVPRVPKPKLNPALFHRRANTPIATKPGTLTKGLKLQKRGEEAAKKAINVYLGPQHQEGSEGAP